MASLVNFVGIGRTAVEASAASIRVHVVATQAITLAVAVAAFATIGREAQAVTKFFVPPASVAGDYNNNGSVDMPDYDLWKTNFGSTTELAADGNNDDVVDAADYTLWRDNFGKSAAPAGNWDDPALWSPAGLPGQSDGAIIHANRTANLSTNAGMIAEMRIGDTVAPPGGTLNVNAGGSLTVLGQVLMGASNPGQFKKGELNLNGGTLTTFGAFFISFEPDATETVNIGPGSLLDVNQNLFGRFGTATINQTGGVVDVQNNVIWGEGGDDDNLGEDYQTRSEYNLSAGELKVGQILSIGGDPTVPRPDSNGRVNITGGMITAGDLIFDSFEGEEAILSITGSGQVRIKQTNYSLADANADITGGFIIGNALAVSTVNLSGTNYTQIVSAAGIGALVAAVPEPSALALLVMGGGFVATMRRKGT